MRAAHLGPELGRGQGARHAAQHGRGAARGARARRPGLRALERLPRDPVGRGRPADRRPRAHQPLLAPVLSGRRSWSTPTASASSTRAPTSATTPTPSTAPRCCASRRASRRRSSTPARCRCCARSTTRRRAPRAWTPTRWAELAGGSASTPALRADRRGVQRRDRGRRVRPDDQGRQAHRGHRAAEVELGAAGRAAAVHRLPDHVRDHLHLRRRARGRRRARARRRRAAAARPVRRGRARRRPVLPQLPGRHRADRRGRVWAPRRIRRPPAERRPRRALDDGGRETAAVGRRAPSSVVLAAALCLIWALTFIAQRIRPARVGPDVDRGRAHGDRSARPLPFLRLMGAFGAGVRRRDRAHQRRRLHRVPARRAGGDRSRARGGDRLHAAGAGRDRRASVAERAADADARGRRADRAGRRDRRERPRAVRGLAGRGRGAVRQRRGVDGGDAASRARRRGCPCSRSSPPSTCWPRRC